MLNLFSTNSKLGLKLKDCLTTYKDYLTEQQFDVIQMGDTRLVGIRKEDRTRVVVNLEFLTANETLVAINQI